MGGRVGYSEDRCTWDCSALDRFGSGISLAFGVPSCNSLLV